MAIRVVTRISTGVLAGFLLAGATFAADVKSDYDRAFDLSKLASFTFSEQSRRSAKDVLGRQ
jgi:hypothetical protein